MKENPTAVRYRQMILDAFMALTKIMPYHEITLLRIVQEADVSRQTFYRHFRTKDEILTALMQCISEGVTEQFASLDQPTRREIFAAYFAFWHKQADFLRIICEGHIESWLIAAYGDIMQEQLEILRPHFAAYTAREFRLVKSFLIGGFYQMKADWYAGEFRETPEKMAALLDGLLTGCAAQKIRHE